MKNFIFAIAAFIPLFFSCDDVVREDVLAPAGTPASSLSATPECVARLLSELPVTLSHVKEVKAGVDASSANGYDEEYPFKQLFAGPGSGVGDELPVGTRSAFQDPSSLGSLISDCFSTTLPTRSGSFVNDLEGSDLQIYWPYSEDWDGKTMPVITFVPDDGSPSNVGFMRETLPDGSTIVKEIMVDERMAMSRPVWVINWNDDAGAMTPQMLEKKGLAVSMTKAGSSFRTLKLKEFKAHNQYDPWWSGGSEFFIKCGSLKAFTADVVSDLKLYNPEITDLMIKVKRKQVEKALRYNAIIVSDWSPQLSECAFLVNEDDGGKMTTWKSTGTVKIRSKSYGFEVEIPYHRNDDIVWRGKLSANFFEKYNGLSTRLGDVSVTFTFD